MRNDTAMPSRVEQEPAAGTKPDYAPRTYTLREQLVMGLKFLVAAGIFFLLIWYS